VSAVTIESSSAITGRKRSRFKRIVISERNYLALKKLGYAGDSFNDVISKLLRIQRNYQENQQQPQQESEDSSNGRPSSPGSLSELFDEHDRQQLAELLGLRRRSNSGYDQARKQ
jgi:predicted CopG family antitoxin